MNKDEVEKGAEDIAYRFCGGGDREELKNLITRLTEKARREGLRRAAEILKLEYPDNYDAMYGYKKIRTEAEASDERI